SAQLLGSAGSAPVSVEDSLRALDHQFDREFLKSCYRGIHFGRSVARYARKPEELYEVGAAFSLQELGRLYPDSLTQEVQRLRDLENELAQLRALHTGMLNPPGGVLRYRGREIKANELPTVINEVERQVVAVEE